MANVLIIDSDAALTRDLKRDLESAGARVNVTSDGAEGLAKAKSDRPDVIVLCVELTRGSGFSVCNKLKKDGELATIPLVLTSAQATEETFEQHRKLQVRAEAYLKKPFETSKLIQVMGEFVELGDGLEDSVEVEFDVEGDAEVEVSGVDIVVEPEAAEQETSVTSARSTQTMISDAEEESIRSENRQLRQKIQRLERDMQDKEVEYNDRLLEESGRARDGLDARKKLGQLERELSKFQQLSERAQAEADHNASAVDGLKAQIKDLESERQVLSDKLGQVVEKVKSLAAERDAMKAQVDEFQSKDANLAEAEETTRKVREKARKAVDIAVQLINETGLIH